MVPEASAAPPAKAAVAVQENGLPEGVKILPVVPDAPTAKSPPPALPAPAGPLIQKRPRLAAAKTEPDPAGSTAKRRKPGRPKAGRLDLPRAIANTVPAPLPPAPPTASKPAGPRSMSDLAPRRAAPHQHTPHAPAIKATHASGKPSHTPKPADAAPASTDAAVKPAKHRRGQAHHVGVPALHYAPIIAFSLRARAHPGLVGLGAIGAVSLGVGGGWGVWQFLNGGPGALTTALLHGGWPLATEAGLLAAVYYIGRSLGQTAIVYGIAREADQRPVTLARQFGVAINTFGRRLRLDLGFGLAELALIAAGGTLLVTGGAAWPINPNLQVGLIFAIYLVLLYLLCALAISRGLAGVNLTLTTHRAGTAAKLGWQLFSHRVELIGPRLSAVLMEAILAVPILAVGLAGVAAADPQDHAAFAVAAGLLAWVAGACSGAGTAAWWSMLYRQLVLADRPGASVPLLSSRQPEEARRGPLALIVALTTLVVAASITVPFLHFS